MRKFIALLWASGFGVTGLVLHIKDIFGKTSFGLTLGFAVIGALIILIHDKIGDVEEVKTPGFMIRFFKRSFFMLIFVIFSLTLFYMYHRTRESEKSILKLSSFLDPWRNISRGDNLAIIAVRSPHRPYTFGFSGSGKMCVYDPNKEGWLYVLEIPEQSLNEIFSKDGFIDTIDFIGTNFYKYKLDPNRLQPIILDFNEK